MMKFMNCVEFESLFDETVPKRRTEYYRKYLDRVVEQLNIVHGVMILNTGS